MEVMEFFKRGQKVWVVTRLGIREGTYLYLRDGNPLCRTVYVDGLKEYRDRRGTVTDCDTFSESKVFSTYDSAAGYVVTALGEPRIKPVSHHISWGDAGDAFYFIDEYGDIMQGRIESVQWNNGCFQYYTDLDGSSVCFERCRDRYFKTREDAAKHYLTLTR